MDTRSASKVEPLAKTSRILGILTVVVVVIAVSILVYARFFLGGADWVCQTGWA
jgi:hypothetical protein